MLPPCRYVEYDFGIPSVTLDGEKSDWEEICRRLDRLGDFGDEASAWADMLRPILRHFIVAMAIPTCHSGSRSCTRPACLAGYRP